MNYSSSFNDDSILARYFGKSSNYTDIPNHLFHEYNVKKGLRNDDGTGVRIGLTRVSDVIGYRSTGAIPSRIWSATAKAISATRRPVSSSCSVFCPTNIPL